LVDIQSLPLAQLQAFCKVYELPSGPSLDGSGQATGANNNITMASMRANLAAVRLIAKGDVVKVTAAERLALFDAWGIPGDYSTSTPDEVIIPLIGYWHAMAMRYQAIGYCRTPHTVADNGKAQPVQTGGGTIWIAVTLEEYLVYTGTGTIPISVTVNQFPRHAGTIQITVTMTAKSPV
jgi:hypothetical protein